MLMPQTALRTFLPTAIALAILCGGGGCASRAYAEQPGQKIRPVRATASSHWKDFLPALATDQADTTQWCADDNAPANGKFTFKQEVFDDWWDAEFETTSNIIGAIHMQSGRWEYERLVAHKITDFTWVYQQMGSDEWREVPGTNIFANRYQLIFRFEPIADVTHMRLLMRKRDESEKIIVHHNNPCLREATFYESNTALIPTSPWFFAVGTWEEGNIYNPLKHQPTGSIFNVLPTIKKALLEITDAIPADAMDEMWIGEFDEVFLKREISKKRNQIVEVGNMKEIGSKLPVSRSYAPWIMHEPAPAGFLMSGSFRDFDESNAKLHSGFYRFLRENYKNVPLLGACGGHQVAAMVLSHPTYESFATEFAKDTVNQVVVTCSTQKAYHCGRKSAHDCCYEGGSPDPFRQVSANVTAYAMPNPYSSPRHDMLLNMLPEKGGFPAFLYHSDYVNPSMISPYFDIIASYPDTVPKLSARNPTLVQGMKVKGYPVYGTQFHWDASAPWDCNRSDGFKNMERVLKNFLLISMNRFNDKATFEVTASSGQDKVQNLFDLDRDTQWCSDGSSSLEFKFPEAVPLKYLVTVEGESAEQAARQSYSYEYSKNGRDWHAMPEPQKKSLFEIQAKGNGCDAKGRPLPGLDDHQSYLTSFGKGVRAKYLRINVNSSGGSACLRELMLLKI